jgi:hypothetical protein
MRVRLPVNLGERLRTLVTRGDAVFFSLGAVYVRSNRLSKKIQQELRHELPFAPAGQAFVRWGRHVSHGADRAMLITGVGRLGNSVLQTLNTRTLARVLDTKETFYHRFDAVENKSLALGDGVTLRKLSILNPGASGRPRLIWRTYALNSDTPLLNPQNVEFGAIKKTLRDLLIPSHALLEKTPRDCLTIYLRSGDVFSHNPEPHYAQPPWAFYEKVLEFKPWSRVEMVAEDEGNPNQVPILRWCQERDIPVDVIGARLEDAVQAVVRSTHLISARGTFIPSLLFLTDDDKEVFQFQDDKNPLMTGKNLTLWRVTDNDGHYVAAVMSRNWANTEAQRALMLDYPGDSLSEIVRMP